MQWSISYVILMLTKTELELFSSRLREIRVEADQLEIEFGNDHLRELYNN